MIKGGLGLSLLLACQAQTTLPSARPSLAVADSDWKWKLPPGYPTPVVPVDNPMTQAKVLLGRHLFYDKRLSQNGQMSCASCHEQQRAFSDGKVTSRGVKGDLLSRNSMALSNVAYAAVLTWANPHLQSLETQMLVPLFGELPPELGLVGQEQVLLDKLKTVPRYVQLFQRAFPEQDAPFQLKNLTAAIACFERSLISANSPYDRSVYEREPLSAEAQRGQTLFFSERLECFHCHGGFNFSDATRHSRTTFQEFSFHNTGLYNLGEVGGYPEPNRGLYELSFLPQDMGKFKAPSLRNIAVTGPYMHDGSIASLGDVLAHYAAGGRTLSEGPHSGIGAKNPYKSGFVKGFKLSENEKADLIAFLNSLTDPDFLNNPDYSNPWPDAVSP